MKCLHKVMLTFIVCQTVLNAQVSAFDINMISVNYQVTSVDVSGFDRIKGEDPQLSEEFQQGYDFSELCPFFRVGASYHFLQINDVSLGILLSYSSGESNTKSPLEYAYRDPNTGDVEIVGIQSDREFEEMTLSLSALYCLYASEERTWEVLTSVQCGYSEIELSREFSPTNPDHQFPEETRPTYPDQIEDQAFSGVHVGVSVTPIYNISESVFVGADLGVGTSMHVGRNELVDATMLSAFAFGLRAGVNL